ncbi:FecR family protein [Phocaeicola sp.]
MDEKVLDKYIKGEATFKERQQVVDWLDDDEKNVREMMALHKLHDIAVMNQAEAGEISPKPEKQHALWRKIGVELLKVAAVIVVLLGIQVLMKTDETGYQTLYVPSGQRAELTLPDGTKVWLNSCSRLVYPQTFGEEREVKLDGEGYFTVAHNDRQAFVVKTSVFDIKVLGTEFNVKAYSASGEQRVDLLDGSVELSGNAIGRKAFRMSPRESVRMVDGRFERLRIDDYDYFKWKEGLICFNNESVGSIIEKLELYYDTHIIVENKNFLNDVYSGKFRTKDGIEQVLKVLQLEHDFTYVKDDNLNLITIK